MDAPATITENELQLERYFEAPPERIWRAITDPDDIRGWLARAEIDLRVGGSVVLKFETEPSVMRGSITELVDGRVLEYTWEEGDTDSIVRFEIAPHDGGTRLTLTHRFERVGNIAGFGAGWHHHLELLEAQASGAPRDWDRSRYEELRRRYV